MTPAQLEHLKLIDAHLERLLDIAAKRTPGEWTVDENLHDGGIRALSDHVFLTREAYLDAPDAAFIASCANNAEAGWKSTRSVIDYLLMMHKHGEGYRYVGLTEDILAAFPLETLT